MTREEYQEIAWKAEAVFCKCRPVSRLPLDANLLGERFHYGISVREDQLAEKWGEAIGRLAAAVELFAAGGGVYFEFLESPHASVVTFASGDEIPRLIVQYHAPTIDENGDPVHGLHEARFDVAGYRKRS